MFNFDKSKREKSEYIYNFILFNKFNKNPIIFLYSEFYNIKITGLKNDGFF